MATKQDLNNFIMQFTDAKTTLSQQADLLEQLMTRFPAPDLLQRLDSQLSITRTPYWGFTMHEIFTEGIKRLLITEKFAEEGISIRGKIPMKRMAELNSILSKISPFIHIRADLMNDQIQKSFTAIIGSFGKIPSDSSMGQKQLKYLIGQILKTNTISGESVCLEAQRLHSQRRYVEAVKKYKQAVALGYLPAYSQLGWLLLHGREGVQFDYRLGCSIANEGMLLGDNDCKGVVSYCRLNIPGQFNMKQGFKLAQESAASGSSYGQFTLGLMYRFSQGEVDWDPNQAAAFYKLAVAQGLDAAQYQLGEMYIWGEGVEIDLDESSRLYHLAAAQGFPEAVKALQFQSAGKKRSLHRNRKQS